MSYILLVFVILDFFRINVFCCVTTHTMGYAITKEIVDEELGLVTEPEYFTWLKNQYDKIFKKTLKSKLENLDLHTMEKWFWRPGGGAGGREKALYTQYVDHNDHRVLDFQYLEKFLIPENMVDNYIR